jgi:diadenosine tetraphosphate (Ap4A) HIT family hydrolase
LSLTPVSAGVSSEFHLHFHIVTRQQFDELADVRTQVWNRVEHCSRHSISSHEGLEFKGIVVLHGKSAASQMQPVLTSSLRPPRSQLFLT